MTTDLEKQFFNTFGIEPYTTKVFGYYRDYYTKQYPQITDRILLELICMLSEWKIYCGRNYPIYSIKTDDLKEEVLSDCFELLKWYEIKKCDKDIKHKVQALFKE